MIAEKHNPTHTSAIKTERPRKKSGYIPSLDGWRAIAILGVLGGHNQPWKLAEILHGKFPFGGQRGVELFFALSGFLICTRLLKEEQQFGAISLRSFYTRRIFRIQPAALTFLLVLSLLMLSGLVKPAWSAVLASVLMLRNIFPMHTPSWETAHFWSLATEEHFYLLLPGFLVLCKRHRLLIMSLLVAACEGWRIFVLHTPRLLGHSYMTPFRTDLVIGGIFLDVFLASPLLNLNWLSLPRFICVPG